MKVALDTNRYVDFCKGEQAVVDVLRRAEHIALPFVTLGELRAGFLCGKRATANARVLASFLNSPRVALLYPDEDTTHHYATLFQQLRTQGTPIPTNDLWIAALAVQHPLVFCTADRHFDHLPQLLRV